MVTSELEKSFKEIGDNLDRFRKPKDPNAYPEPRELKEDPEIEKIRAMWLKLLLYLVGGFTIILLAWRLILKFI